MNRNCRALARMSEVFNISWDEEDSPPPLSPTRKPRKPWDLWWYPNARPRDTTSILTDRDRGHNRLRTKKKHPKRQAYT